MGIMVAFDFLKATIKRFHDHCKEHSIAADFEKKFKVTYTSNIPQQVGLTAGSSAIITATFRALMDFHGVSIDQPVLPNLIREVETQELSIPAEGSRTVWFRFMTH